MSNQDFNSRAKIGTCAEAVVESFLLSRGHRVHRTGIEQHYPPEACRAIARLAGGNPELSWIKFCPDFCVYRSDNGCVVYVEAKASDYIEWHAYQSYMKRAERFPVYIFSVCSTSLKIADVRRLQFVFPTWRQGDFGNGSGKNGNAIDWNATKPEIIPLMAVENSLVGR